MIAGINGSAIFKGFRGKPPADREALERVLVSLSDMVMNYQEISELDINRLWSTRKGRPRLWQIAALSSKRPATGK